MHDSIHWRGVGTVLVASLQSRLFFQRITKMGKTVMNGNRYFYLWRITVINGSILVLSVRAERDFSRDTSLNGYVIMW